MPRYPANNPLETNLGSPAVTADQLAYQFGGLMGTAIFLLLLSQLIHWIVRKIRRKPKKLFREWLNSWIAGPEISLALCA
jgi:hypothetical protein